MTLTFSQGHRVTGKLELVQSVVWLHEVPRMFVKVDYVREMTSQTSGWCGKYESLEHWS